MTKKRKFLDQLDNSNSNYFVTKGPSDGFDNHCHALRPCTGRYVLQVGDDDLVHTSVVPEILSCIKRDDVIGLKGIFGPFKQHLENGQVRTFELPKLSSELLENRVKSLCAAIPFGNPGFQMIWDREQYTRAYNFILKMPYRVFWNDHILVLHALMDGNFVEINKPFMSFNFENWTDKHLTLSEANHLLAGGAPKSLALVYRIILGFEGAQLVYRSTNNALASSIWFKSWHKAFKVELVRYESNQSIFFDCLKFDTVRRFIDHLNIKKQLTLSELCDDISNFYAAISEKDIKYRCFWMRCHQQTEINL